MEGRLRTDSEARKLVFSTLPSFFYNHISRREANNPIPHTRGAVVHKLNNFLQCRPSPDLLTKHGILHSVNHLHLNEQTLWYRGINGKWFISPTNETLIGPARKYNPSHGSTTLAESLELHQTGINTASERFNSLFFFSSFFTFLLLFTDHDGITIVVHFNSSLLIRVACYRLIYQLLSHNPFYFFISFFLSLSLCV